MLYLSAQAERDLANQIEWLAERSPKAAERAVERILHVFDLLELNPHLGPDTDRGWREKTVRFGRDGYVICYRVRNNDVFVVRFKHARQAR